MQSLGTLPENRRRGSKPRCHWITHGDPDVVAARLTAIIAPWGKVSPTDHWMPQGFSNIEEAELHKAPRLLDDASRSELKSWWFKIARGKQTAPSFDIASTCMLHGSSRRGILLVEAKAHHSELANEDGGKRLALMHSPAQAENHAHIAEAIAEANRQLAAATGEPWQLSHNACYQMSNRFATACKLTALGYPTILVYLGFTGAEDVADLGQPLKDAADWFKAVLMHSSALFPLQVWNHVYSVHGQPFVAGVRTTTTRHDEPIMDFAVR
jgi:hypothetical protein